jgi:hypothetical protein
MPTPGRTWLLVKERNMTKKNAALPTKQSPAPDPKKDRAPGKEHEPLRERAKALSRQGMNSMEVLHRLGITVDEMFALFTPQEQAAAVAFALAVRCMGNTIP